MKRVLALLVAFAFLLPPAATSDEADTDARSGTDVTETGPGGAAPGMRMTGFRAKDAEAEREREARAALLIRPDSLRRHLRILTEEPHVAGTPADSATAEYVRQRLTAYGWDARIERVPVYLNWPGVPHVELVEPSFEALATREKGAAWDKDAYQSEAFDAFHGYGAAGEVTAGVVYANYGDVGDLKKLAELGIDVRGRIVLVRYGKIFRGLKVRNAERAGAAAVIIYSDPADDGYVKADPYPRGPGRPDDAIQRGSVQFLSEGPGDPTTPGWASEAGGKRLKPSEAKGVPRIPSIPLAYSEARRILDALEGPQVPDGWQGGLPFTYHVGPGPAKVHMKIEQNYAVRPIWNVIATLKGRETPEQQVLCGNHRDAWVCGAIDPNSGTICLLEMARAIGEVAKTGWRPRRTITLCSWDGEEYGLLGSTEYAEKHAVDLTANAVAYLNVDVAVAGKDFRVNGCHALRDVLVEAMTDVREPAKNQSLYQAWYDRAWAEGKADWTRRNRERRWRAEGPRPFEVNVAPLGSGSDYTAFVDHLGVPALDLRFEGLQGTYHSMYDDFEYLDRVVDPGYAYHSAMTDLWARVAMRLAEAEIMPLRYSNTGTFALDELQSIEERADDAGAGKPDSLRFTATLDAVRKSAAHLRNAALTTERQIDGTLENLGPWGIGGAARVNANLIAAERGLLGTGLPGREWFRHELYAPGLNTGYAPVPMPRLGQAILDADARAYARGISPIAEALDRAAVKLEKAK